MTVSMVGQQKENKQSLTKDSNYLQYYNNFDKNLSVRVVLV